jgi:hypothetical protein
MVELGRTVITPGAQAELNRLGISPYLLFLRQEMQDWGEAPAEDRAANERALKDGSRILSVYSYDGITFWVITEAVADSGHRESTCILLPEEY